MALTAPAHSTDEAAERSPAVNVGNLSPTARGYAGGALG